MQTDILIIGGSAAGIMTAKTAAKHYPNKKITVVRKEEKVLIPCGIPYTMATVNGPEENLIPDQAVTGIADLVIDEVVDINREAKSIKLKTGKEITYEKLVLTNGSNVNYPPIKGIDLEEVFPIKRDIDLLDKLRSKVDNSDNLVIIGGGFIGVEFADECRKNRDINISLIEIEEHCLSLVCDNDICMKVENKLEENRINLLVKRKVVEIIGDESVEKIKLDNGQEIDADLVILGTGVSPSIDLAKKAGVEYDKRKGIIVDEFMKTSDDDIFACGDCAEKASFFSNKIQAGRLASIATTEGRLVGANLYEEKRVKQGSIGIFSTIVDDLSLGAAGLTEKQATDLGIEVVIGQFAKMNRHPGKMPGGAELGVKLIFRSEDGVLIGAQAYGDYSVGEFINILGLAIEKEMTAEDLAVLQVGTHPALTASPIAYQITNAAESVILKL